MPSPHPGDFLLRGSFAAGFDLCDACTLRHISGPHSLMDAVQLANTYCKGRSGTSPWAMTGVP